MKIILTFIAFMYHGDGSVETKPSQTIEFADKAMCEDMRTALLRRNWDNPLPIPAGKKPEDYSFSRYQVGACAEAKKKTAEEPKAEDAPTEEPKSP